MKVSADVRASGNIDDYAVGDTYVRSAESGLDEAFQLIIPKAKVLSENTITMEAKLRPLAS